MRKWINIGEKEIKGDWDTCKAGLEGGNNWYNVKWKKLLYDMYVYIDI